ncbi:MAG TPA: DNA repair protein RecO [Acidimicrobiales bacterium]|nr:DNA repair protein RecO [Acidimicrobiales bacterium]
MALYRDEGVVLRTHKLGEADRVVVLLTRGRGKIRAVAKGVRKTKSRFGARLEPPGHVNLLMYEGRDLHTINQAETVDHYRSLREDLERLTDAMAILESVDQVAQDGEPNPALFRMLTGALRALGEAPARPALLVGAFYWKLLALDGVAPLLDRCAVCDAGPEELVAFDFVEGGALCRQHRRGPAVDPAALGLVRRILGGGLAGVLAEPAGPATAAASALGTSALEAHLERRLRAVHLLGN